MPSSGVMISRELQITLQLAMTEAINRRHEYVCLEHVLYAMLHDVTTSNVLKHCGADLEALRKKLQKYLDEEVERLPKGEQLQPHYANGVQRALQRAAAHVQSAGRSEITGAQVLVALFHEEESQGVYFLQEQGVTRFDVINFISHGVSKNGAGDDEDREVRGAGDGEKENEGEGAIHILLRRRKNNPVFVGEAGVGKTALAEGLALAIHDGRVPAVLKDVQIFALDMGALL